MPTAKSSKSKKSNPSAKGPTFEDTIQKMEEDLQRTRTQQKKVQKEVFNLDQGEEEEDEEHEEHPPPSSPNPLSEDIEGPMASSKDIEPLLQKPPSQNEENEVELPSSKTPNSPESETPRDLAPYEFSHKGYDECSKYEQMNSEIHSQIMAMAKSLTQAEGDQSMPEWDELVAVSRFQMGDDSTSLTEFAHDEPHGLQDRVLVNLNPRTNLLKEAKSYEQIVSVLEAFLNQQCFFCLKDCCIQEQMSYMAYNSTNKVIDDISQIIRQNHDGRSRIWHSLTMKSVMTEAQMTNLMRESQKEKVPFGEPPREPISSVSKTQEKSTSGRKEKEPSSSGRRTQEKSTSGRREKESPKSTSRQEITLQEYTKMQDQVREMSALLEQFKGPPAHLREDVSGITSIDPEPENPKKAPNNLMDISYHTTGEDGHKNPTFLTTIEKLPTWHTFTPGMTDNSRLLKFVTLAEQNGQDLLISKWPLDLQHRITQCYRLFLHQEQQRLGVNAPGRASSWTHMTTPELRQWLEELMDPKWQESREGSQYQQLLSHLLSTRYEIDWTLGGQPLQHPFVTLTGSLLYRWERDVHPTLAQETPQRQKEIESTLSKQFLASLKHKNVNEAFKADLQANIKSTVSIHEGFAQTIYSTEVFVVDMLEKLRLTRSFYQGPSASGKQYNVKKQSSSTSISSSTPSQKSAGKHPRPQNNPRATINRNLDELDSEDNDSDTPAKRKKRIKIAARTCRGCGWTMSRQPNGVYKCPRNKGKGCGDDPRKNFTGDPWEDSKVGQAWISKGFHRGIPGPDWVTLERAAEYRRQLTNQSSSGKTSASKQGGKKSSHGK
jgi:hypothetical protein